MSRKKLHSFRFFYRHPLLIFSKGEFFRVMQHTRSRKSMRRVTRTSTHTIAKLKKSSGRNCRLRSAIPLHRMRCGLQHASSAHRNPCSSTARLALDDYAANASRSHPMDCAQHRQPAAATAPYTFLFASNRIYEP